MDDRTVSHVRVTPNRACMGDLVERLAVLLRDAQPPFLQRSEIRDTQAWTPRPSRNDVP